MGEGLPIVEPHLSKSTHSGLKMTVGKVSRTGKGLGKNLQGMARALQVITQTNKKGLGFQANAHSREQREKRTYNQEMTRSLGRERQLKLIMFPSLYKIFHLGRRIDPSQLEEQKAKDVMVILNKALNSLYFQETEP